MSAIEREIKQCDNDIDYLKKSYVVVEDDLKTLQNANLNEMDEVRANRQKKRIHETQKELDDLHQQLAEKEQELVKLKSHQPLTPEQGHFAIDIFKQKTQSIGKNATDKEKAELYELKLKMHEEMFDDFDQKMKKDYPYIIFDRLLAQNPLRPLEEGALRTFISDKKTTYYEKAIVVSSLSLSLIEKLEETRLEILLDFVLQNEQQVWQRALVGLVLALRGKEQKISKAFTQRLQNLKSMPHIQEALFYMANAYRAFQRDLQEKNSNNLLLEIFAKMKNYDFFEKPQHWFLPFYPENEAAKASIHNSKHNINASDFMALLANSITVCNVDKYALCFHFEELREFQVTGLEEAFNNEKIQLDELAKSEEKEIDNAIYSLYFQDLYQFYTHYPKEKYRNDVLAQQELYGKALLDLLAENIVQIRMEAQKHFEANNYLQASHSYEQYLQLNPKDHEAWNNLGNAYNALQNYEKAIDSYLKAIAFKPDLHEAWNNLGFAYGKLQNYEKAIDSYQKATAFKPDKHEAWNNLGNAYRNLQNYEKAIESYQKAIVFKADYHDAWNNLGIAYYNLQNYEKAIESYLKAIAFKPDDHEAWYNLGIAYYNLQNYEKAIESYLKAIEIKPDKHEAWFGLGIAYHNLQNYEKAIESYQKAIAIKADDHEAWYNLGLAYAALQNYKKAKECFEKSIQIKPDKEEAYFNLACTYSLEKNKGKALLYLQKAIELNPNERKENAQQDTDFEWLWEDADFKLLVS